MRLQFGALRRLAFHAPLAAAALAGSRAASCTDDATTFKSLMARVPLDERYYPDLATIGVGSVEGLMSIGEAKLSHEPPDAAVIHAVLASAQAVSTLAAPHAMPLRDGTNFANTVHGDAVAAGAGYATMHAQVQAAPPHRRVPAFSDRPARAGGHAVPPREGVPAIDHRGEDEVRRPGCRRCS